MRTLAKRYARGLFRLFSEPSAQTDCLQQLGVVGGLFECKEASEVLGSVVMPNDLKLGLVAYACDKAKASQGVRDLLHVLLQAKRVMLFPLVLEEFRKLFDASRGLTRAVVRVPLALSQEEEQELIGEVREYFPSQTEYCIREDANLLGGVVIQVGNQVIDMSLRRIISDTVQGEAL